MIAKTLLEGGGGVSSELSFLIVTKSLTVVTKFSQRVHCILVSDIMGYSLNTWFEAKRTFKHKITVVLYPNFNGFSLLLHKLNSMMIAYPLHVAKCYISRDVRTSAHMQPVQPS